MAYLIWLIRITLNYDTIGTFLIMNLIIRSNLD